MVYKITDPLETVTFVEGHNQFGPNSLSHYTVFVGEDSERYIPKPGPEQVWIRLDSIQKEIHNPGEFLKRAQRSGHSVSEQRIADAYKPTTEIQRMPQKVLKPGWALPLVNK
jgi:hypothetical protein